MITIEKQPAAVMLSENPVVFGFKTNNQIANPGRPSINQIEFKEVATAGKKFTIKYGGESLDFEFAANPDDSGLQLPVSTGTTNDVAFYATLVSALLKNYYLLRDFYIAVYNNNSIRLTARKSVTTTDIALTSTANFTNTIIQTGQERALHPNFKVLAELFARRFDSSEFESVSVAFLEVDEAGGSEYDISAVLSAYLLRKGYDLPNISAANFEKSNKTVCEYYMRYAEVYGDVQAVRAIAETGKYAALLGGFSKAMVGRKVFPDSFIADGKVKFLAQRGAEQVVKAAQPNWLTWCNLLGAAAVKIEAKVSYSDGTTAKKELARFENLVKYEKLSLTAGLLQNGLHLLDAQKVIKSYEIYLADLAGADLSERVTFHVDYKFDPYLQFYIYVNSLAAVEGCYTTGRTEVGYDLDISTAAAGYSDYKLSEEIEYLLAARHKEEVSTGYMSRKAMRTWKDFFLSRSRFTIKNGLGYPVCLGNKEIKEYKDGDTLHALKFTLSYAYVDEHFTVDEDTDGSDYSSADLVNWLPPSLDKPPDNFDDRYFLKSETYNRAHIDGLVADLATRLDGVDADLYTQLSTAINLILTKADKNHTHDGQYITPSEGANLLSVAYSAQSAAIAAQGTVNALNTTVLSWTKDNNLSPIDKKQAKLELETLTVQYNTALTEAASFNVSTAAISTQFTALQNYLSPFLSDMEASTPVDGDEFRSKFKAYGQAYVDFRKSISEAAKDYTNSISNAAEARAIATAASDATQKAQTAEANAKALIDAIAIGGSNLLINSEPKHTATSSGEVAKWTISEALTVGDEYISSAKLSGNTAGWIYQLSTSETDWTGARVVTLSTPFIADKEYTYFRAFCPDPFTAAGTVERANLEPGNKESTWSPSVADVNKAISEAVAAASAAQAATNALSGRLKAMAFEEVVEFGKLGNTIQQGGYLKNSVIDTDALRVLIVTAQYVNTLSLEADSIKAGIFKTPAGKKYMDANTGTFYGRMEFADGSDMDDALSTVKSEAASDAQAKANAAQAAAIVSASANSNNLLNGLQIGTRNYVLKSLAAEWNQDRTDGVVDVTTIDDSRWGKVVKFERKSSVGGYTIFNSLFGLQYSLRGTICTAYAIAVDNGGFDFGFGGLGSGYPLFRVSNADSIDIGDGWKVYYKTFIVSPNGLNSGQSFGIADVFGKGKIYCIGIVSGNKPPLSYLQAPEDMEAYTDNAANKAKLDAEHAAKVYADAQDNLKKIEAEAYADGIVTAEEQARIADATAKLNEAKQDATDKINSLTIGVTNLILGTDKDAVNIVGYGVGSDSAYFVGVYKISQKLIEGNTYTFACDNINITPDTTDQGGLNYGLNIYIGNNAPAWTELVPIVNKLTGASPFTFTFTAPAGIDYSKQMYVWFYRNNSILPVFISGMRLVPGSKAADWSAAPEDFKLGITNLYSETSTYINIVQGVANIVKENYGFSVIGNQENTGVVRLHELIKSNGWYAISFEHKTDYIDMSLSVDVCDVMVGSFISYHGVWTRFEGVINVKNQGGIYDFIDINGFSAQTHRIRNISVVQGSKTVSFTPSPEDQKAYSDKIAQEKSAAVQASLQAEINTIKTTAETANDAAAAVSNDNLLSAGKEKSEEYAKWQQVQAERDYYVNTADAIGVSSVDLRSAYNALEAYVNSLNPALSATGSSTTIVGANYRSTWSAYINARMKISLAAADLANNRIGKKVIIDPVTGMIVADLIDVEKIIARQFATGTGNGRTTINENGNGLMEIRWGNGQVGIKMGLINNEPAIQFFNSSGIKVWEGGRNGIVYVTSIPAAINRMDMFNFYEGSNETQAPAHVTVIVNQRGEVISNTVSYLYTAGTNSDTASNKVYEGYHKANDKTSPWLDNGWYTNAGEQPLDPMDGTDPVIYIMYIKAGKVVNSASVTCTIQQS